MVDVVELHLVRDGLAIDLRLRATGPSAPGDVAEAARYLVSDEAHYLTGALILVAGGLLMI